MIHRRLRKPSEARSATVPITSNRMAPASASHITAQSLRRCRDPISTSSTPAMISPMPTPIGQVNGSPKIAAANTAVPTVPSAPQTPYATPIGIPARSTMVSNTNAPI